MTLAKRKTTDFNIVSYEDLKIIYLWIEAGRCWSTATWCGRYCQVSLPGKCCVICQHTHPRTLECSITPLREPQISKSAIYLIKCSLCDCMSDWVTLLLPWLSGPDCHGYDGSSEGLCYVRYKLRLMNELSNKHIIKDSRISCCYTCR